MPLLKRFFAARTIGIGSMLVTTLCIVIAASGSSPALAWALAVPVATAAATGYGAVIMLFVDEAAANRGEVLGVTASINALAFGAISLIGGVAGGEFAAAPIFASAALMGIATLLLVFAKRVLSGTQPSVAAL
jgi:predicted MFS family arabinose efflux permease